MVTSPLKDEWQSIVDKTFDLLNDYTSKFDHISEITLTWVRPEPQNAPLAEARIITVEEQSEPASSRNSGFSVKIAGIGTMAANQKSDKMGFHAPRQRETIRVCPPVEKRNPERLRSIERKRFLKRHYGLSPEDYNQMLEAQDSCCAICLKHTAAMNPSIWQSITVMKPVKLEGFCATTAIET